MTSLQICRNAVQLPEAPAHDWDGIFIVVVCATFAVAALIYTWVFI